MRPLEKEESDMVRRKTLELASVEPQSAMEHALLAFRRSWAAGVPDFASWGTVVLDPRPLLIHDLNGEPLFYEFTALKGNQTVGRIRTSATKRLGAPVFTVALTPHRWNPQKGIAAAQRETKRLYPKATITGRQLVCYSYPMMGVRVDLQLSARKTKSTLFDLVTGRQVTSFGTPTSNEIAASSMLDSLSPDEIEKRTRRWELRDQEREIAKIKTPRLFDEGFTEREAAQLQGSFNLVGEFEEIEFITTREVKYSPRCDTHVCFELYGQQEWTWCRYATAQMILDFYRYNYEQEELIGAREVEMGPYTYGSRTNYCLVGHTINHPVWEDARREINANRPFESRIEPGHTRACAGWKCENIAYVGQSATRELKIFDPYSPSHDLDVCTGGEVVWEDITSVTYTELTHVRHRETPCE
jgi:hypothetical protein